MRKMISIVVTCLCMALLTACSSDQATPEGTVTKAIKYLMEKDYQGYADLIQFKNADQLTKEQLEAKKTQVIAILQDKYTKQVESKGGIKSFDVQPAEIDGEQAKVKATITYNNDETKDQNFDLVKIDDKWMLDAGK